MVHTAAASSFAVNNPLCSSSTKRGYSVTHTHTHTLLALSLLQTPSFTSSSTCYIVSCVCTPPFLCSCKDLKIFFLEQSSDKWAINLVLLKKIYIMDLEVIVVSLLNTNLSCSSTIGLPTKYIYRRRSSSHATCLVAAKSASRQERERSK